MTSDLASKPSHATRESCRARACPGGRRGTWARCVSGEGHLPLRLFTWTAVLYAALAMPLLGWMLPPLPVPMPAMLQSARRRRGSGSATRCRRTSGGSEDRLLAPARHKQDIDPRSRSRRAGHVSLASETALPAAESASSRSIRIQWSSIPWTSVATGSIWPSLCFFLRALWSDSSSRVD